MITIKKERIQQFEIEWREAGGTQRLFLLYKSPLVSFVANPIFALLFLGCNAGLAYALIGGIILQEEYLFYVGILAAMVCSFFIPLSLFADEHSWLNKLLKRPFAIITHNK